MFRFAAHHPARLAVILPALLLVGCGGNNSVSIITVPNSVVTGDLNGDGLQDVVIAAAQIDQTGQENKPGLLGIELNSAASPGNFGVGVNYQVSGAPPSGLAIGDLTGNGSHDIVVANLNAGTVSLFRETTPTSGAYSAAVSITVGGGPNDVQMADLNGDGLPDLVVADNTGKVTYLLQNPQKPGSFLPPVSLPITNRGISVAVGDLNGDGLPDLAVTSFDAGGNNGLITIYFQDPNNPGTFITTPMVITAYGEPSQIRIADVNQDGMNDIVVACQGLGSNANINDPDPNSIAIKEALFGAMVILQNTGAPGTFGTPVTNPGQPGTISLAIGDLNNDGLPDIAMTTLYPQGQGTIVILPQDPSTPGNFFGLPATYAGSGQPVSISIADLDHDGLPDLVVADALSATWYRNISTQPGSFVFQAQIGTFQ